MTKSTVPIELPGAPTADLHATTKAYVDEGLADKPGMPYIGVVPAGSTTPTVEHSLGTTDVDVTVYRTTDGVQVGVPADRIDADNVQLTFATAPTGGQYRIVVSAGTGAGGPGGGGTGGTPDPHAASHATNGSDPLAPGAIGAATSSHLHTGVYSPVNHTHEGAGGPHASTHATGGSDPVTPAAIGAAAVSHDHGGDYASVVHNHSGLVVNGGTTGQVLTKDSSDHYDYSWQDPQGGGGPSGPSALKPYPPITLTPTPISGFPTAFTIATNAALGNHFRVDIPTSPTNASVYPSKPTNGVPGQTIMYEVRNPNTTGNPNTFELSAFATAFGFTAAFDYGDVQQIHIFKGVVDYVVLIYDERGRGGVGAWRVLSWTKNFPIIGSNPA